MSVFYWNVSCRNLIYVVLTTIRFNIRVELIDFKGLIWPTFAGFWTSWVPIAEHGRLIGLAYAGSQIGNASVFLL